ncbi:MAG TPA: ImmA/IrrE family metallo-endopeptidase [Bacteroidales bacterium]|mgnify:CR=1 FL=1|nr:ImmA/IrrE family metallo-endopeptidase [Bacteroidales bacterium]
MNLNHVRMGFKTINKPMIERLASDLAESFFRYPGPVVPQTIAEGLEIGYCYVRRNDAFDGLIEYFEGEWFIYINLRNDQSNPSHPRVRFSFAHELGHYIIDDHRVNLRKPGVRPHGSQGMLWIDIKAEREAEYFAAALLMPREWVLYDLRGRKFSAALIEEISNNYQVSYTAALMRFIELGNHPILVVCSHNNIIQWRQMSEDFPFRLINEGPGKQLPECSAAAEFFADGRRYSKPEEVYAGDWFRIYQPQDNRRKFFEYCIYFAERQTVISVLWEG